MTDLITDEYRKLNNDLHETRPDYGAGAATKQWLPMISELANALSARSILDYGCGKGALAMSLSHYIVIGYDPAIPGKDMKPDPQDFVVCLDVLEHIEPECLDAVLDDLKRCATKGIFLSVSTRPAVKKLSDGRNAHLIQEDQNWWLPKIMERWNMRVFQATPSEFVVFAINNEAVEAQEAAA